MNLIAHGRALAPLHHERTVICHRYRLKLHLLNNIAMTATRKQRLAWKRCVLQMSVRPPTTSVDKVEVAASDLSLDTARRKNSLDASGTEVQRPDKMAIGKVMATTTLELT